MSIDSEPKSSGEHDNDKPRFPVMEAEKWPVFEEPNEHQTLHGVEPWDQGLEISDDHKILELEDGSVLKAVIKADGLELAVVDRGESTPPDEPRYAFVTKDYAGGDKGIYAVETNAPQLLGRHNLGIDTKPPGSREQRGLFAFQILGNGQLHVLAHDKASGKIEVLWGMSPQDEVGREAVESTPVGLDLDSVHESEIPPTLPAESAEVARPSQEIQKESVWAEVFADGDALRRALQSPNEFNLGPDEQHTLNTLVESWRYAHLDEEVQKVWESQIAPQLDTVSSDVDTLLHAFPNLQDIATQLNADLVTLQGEGNLFGASFQESAGNLSMRYRDLITAVSAVENSAQLIDMKTAVNTLETESIREAIRKEPESLSGDEAQQLIVEVGSRIQNGEELSQIIGVLDGATGREPVGKWLRYNRRYVEEAVVKARAALNDNNIESWRTLSQSIWILEQVSENDLPTLSSQVNLFKQRLDARRTSLEQAQAAVTEARAARF